MILCVFITTFFYETQAKGLNVRFILLLCEDFLDRKLVSCMVNGKRHKKCGVSAPSTDETTREVKPVRYAFTLSEKLKCHNFYMNVFIYAWKKEFICTWNILPLRS